MFLALLSKSDLKEKDLPGTTFLPPGEGRPYAIILDPAPKRHRLAEVLRNLTPRGDFSIVTQSDLLAYGQPNVKATRSVFMVKVNSLLELAQAAYNAVKGGVFSVYGQRIFEFETARHSRWRISIFSGLPGDVNRYFSELSPSDVRVVRYKREGSLDR